MSHSRGHGHPPVKWLPTLLLLISAIGSAVTLVQIKHRTRAMTAELDALRRTEESLNVEFAQLQLEEAVYADHMRIETIARDTLKMVKPTDVRTVRGLHGR